MNINVLRHFIAVVQEQGISAAADVLQMSQPALSRQIRELEEDLGVTLFARGNRGRAIELTPEGVTFYRRAREIVELADRARAEVHRRAPLEDVVHIAAAQSNVMTLVGRAATRTRIAHPNITFALHDDHTPNNVERLNNGLADFAVLVQPTDLSRFDYAALPGGDHLGILMREDDPLAQSAAITQKVLPTLPLIVARGSIERRDLSGWLIGGSRQDINIIGTMNLLYNAACFVREGYGYALTPEGLVDEEPGSGLTFRPLDPPLQLHLCVAWRNDRDLSAPARAFLHEMRAVIAAAE